MATNANAAIPSRPRTRPVWHPPAREGHLAALVGPAVESDGPSETWRRDPGEHSVDFEFSEEQQAFAKEVAAFCDAHDDPEIFDVTRENMAQIVDTPKRRAFMKELGRRGWLGITWPKEYGGQEGEGVYEYILNEELAGRGGPQIGKGVGIIGKTLIAHGSEELKAEFLPMILENDVEFAVGYSEPNAGSDAASMRLRAVRHTQDGVDGWLLNGQKTWTTSAHFAEWYWLGTRTDPDDKHGGITLMLVPLDQPGITIKGIWTMGDERTNEVFIDNVFVPDRYVVGEVGAGFRYISQALDLERFTMFTFSPIRQRLDLLTDYVRSATRDGEPLRDDPVVRSQMANLHTEAEVARVMGLKFVAESMKVERAARAGEPFQPPTVVASEYKLFATELSKRLANAAMDIAGPGSQLRVHTEDAPMAGRSESTYRYTVIDTIGGGSSEIQKNIIARRGLGLPKNF
jgi:alkylation response protein AidB-like acyl-CoA dehydrogenase